MNTGTDKAPTTPKAKGGKILADLTPPSTPQVAAAEATTKRKKNANIKIEYVAPDGSKSGSPSEDVIGFDVTTKEGTKEVRFAQLPNSILLQMAAFGGNTVYRNEYNTTLNTEGKDEDEAEEALQTRHDGFLQGVWKATGDGSSSAIPLRIEAIKRAFIDAGKTEDEATALYNKALDAYRALPTKEAKAEQLKLWGKKGSIQRAEDAIKLERMQAKVAKQGTVAKDDLSDLI